MAGGRNRGKAWLGGSAQRMLVLNDRLNQMVIEHLDPAAWRAKPPGNVRTIAAIFAHVHNVRCKWVRLTAPHLRGSRATESGAL